jgi:ABC-type transport system involved in cytochrome c biogenesis permease subunit
MHWFNKVETMSSYRPLVLILALLVVGGTPAALAADGDKSANANKGASADTAAFDWTAWKHLPVFHKGRVMPLDTFAREQVEAICGRESPTLALKQAVTKDEFERLANSPARKLFPDDEPRKFQPVELLFSWLVEPDAWEEVPFLLATNQDLRQELLEVPIRHEETNAHLKYVSPRQVKDAEGFALRLRELGDQQQAARSSGQEFSLEGVDKQVEELVGVYLAYRQLSFDPELDAEARRAFNRQFDEVVNTWTTLQGPLEGFVQPHDDGGLGAQVNTLMRALATLEEMSRQPTFGRVEAEAAIGLLEQSAGALGDEFATFQKKLVDGPAPPNFNEEQLQSAKVMIARLTWGMKELRTQAERLRAALYENDELLRVAPALNAVALSKDRDTTDRAPPWIDLQTLLEAPLTSPVLRDYPAERVEDVRKAFQRARAAYLDRDPLDFADYSRQFDESLAALASATEPLREKLPSVDEELRKYTARPEASYTANEVRYNRLDPFKWSWVISLLGLACFALAFGVARRPMYWAGMAILGLGLAWAAYGFYLRVSVTRWAPVTNMYETVIYVPFFVTVLGIWFALLPMLWPGVSWAWKLTAAPFTWETLGFKDEEKVGWVNLASLVPRLALMGFVFYTSTLAKYASGDQPILTLMPNVDIGSTMPDGNDLLVWVVKMCLLIWSVWYIPRAMVAGVISLVTIPLTLRDHWREYIPQVYPRRVFVASAAFVAAVCWMVAWYAPVLDDSFTPLQPVLRDNFWLTIHVLTIVSSYGAGALAWGLGNIALLYYLFGKYRQPTASQLVAAGTGHRPADEPTPTVSLSARPPEACATLAGYTYKAMQVAVLLLAAGTILGGLWADVSWGRFWGWDPKEVWALISLLVYLAILHGRYAGWFGNFGLAAGAVLGATAIVFSWYGVNFVLGAGLHSYGFGAGGQAEVGTFVVANWILLAAAAFRYRAEMGAGHVPPELDAESVEEEENMTGAGAST